MMKKKKKKKKKEEKKEKEILRSESSEIGPVLSLIYKYGSSQDYIITLYALRRFL